MSWDQLLGIYQANEEAYEQWLSDPPKSCPNDGQPLQVDANGDLHCVFDGWIWNGDPYTKAD